jgi:hypothetical protein
MNSVAMERDCKTQGCTNPAIVALAGENVCLDHFLADCYVHLDKLEKLVCKNSMSADEIKDALSVLQECSNLALAISFRDQPLSNLQRSRLLHILLSCGDLQLHLVRPNPQFPYSAPPAPLRRTSAAASCGGPGQNGPRGNT